MAKLTAKFRVGEYSTSENHFHIHFQLRSTPADGFEFSLVYDAHSFRLTDDALFYLSGLGYDTDQITGEALEWLYKHRQKFGGSTWNEVLWRRVEIGMQTHAIAAAAEKERRGRAAIERIQAEAPCLDWAMSVKEELDDAIGVVAGTQSFTAPNGSTVTKFYQDGVFTHEIASAPDFIGHRPEWINNTFFSTPLKDDSPAAKAIRAGMETARQAMEAAGLGEEPANVELPDGWEVASPDDRPTMFVDALNAVIPKLVDEVRNITGIPFNDWSGKKQVLKDALRRTFQDAFKITTVDRPQQYRDAEATRYQYHRKIAAERTDKAVNAIHTHARRYLTPMSLREHDFLRSIFKEEIERVVGGVL